MSTEPLVVGAVAYTPNVVPIWEGIRGYFQDSESRTPKWISCSTPTTRGWSIR